MVRAVRRGAVLVATSTCSDVVFFVVMRHCSALIFWIDNVLGRGKNVPTGDFAVLRELEKL